jgi:hypothetical protein
LVEVAEIWIGGDDSRHRRDVKAKEAAAYDGDRSDDIDVAYGIHFGRRYLNDKEPRLEARNRISTGYSKPAVDLERYVRVVKRLRERHICTID